MNELLSQVDLNVGRSREVCGGHREVLVVGALNHVELSIDHVAGAYEGWFGGFSKDQYFGEPRGGEDLGLRHEIGLAVFNAPRQSGPIISIANKFSTCSCSFTQANFVSVCKYIAASREWCSRSEVADDAARHYFIEAAISSENEGDVLVHSVDS